MKLILLFALGFMLFFGCLGQPAEEKPGEPAAPEEPEPPAEESPGETVTCEEYCAGLTHVQCVGEWSISGSYPDCECEFVCDAEEELPEEETEETGEESGTYAPTTTKSLDEMMDDVLETLRTDFYRYNSGSFQMNTYTWKGVIKDTYPGDITVDKNIAAEVEFDGTVISSLQASGFISFENTGTGSTTAYGFAIFEEESPALDSYNTFGAEYLSSVIDKGVDDCQVYDKILEKNKDGEYVSTYLFVCEDVYDL